jgi:hypothetical protein
VVVMVLRASIGTEAWHKWIHDHAEVRPLKRLRFGNATNKAPFDSAVVIFR